MFIYIFIYISLYIYISSHDIVAYGIFLLVPEYHGTYLRCPQFHGLPETSPMSCKPPVTSMPCLVSFQLAMFDCQSEQGWTCQSFFDGKIWEIRGNSGNIGFKKMKDVFFGENCGEIMEYGEHQS